MEWITRKEAMDTLGISKSRLSQLIKAGRIETSEKLVSKQDVERQKATAKSGRKRVVEVGHEGIVSEYTVIDSLDLGDAEFIHFWCTESESSVAAFVYPDGSVVTTDDWQGKQPEYITDVKEYGWMLCTAEGFEPCVFVSGLPRSATL